jgi:hypothetical protein
VPVFLWHLRPHRGGIGARRIEGTLVVSTPGGLERILSREIASLARRADRQILAIPMQRTDGRQDGPVEAAKTLDKNSATASRM